MNPIQALLLPIWQESSPSEPFGRVATERDLAIARRHRDADNRMSRQSERNLG